MAFNPERGQSKRATEEGHGCPDSNARSSESTARQTVQTEYPDYSPLYTSQGDEV